MSIYIYEYIYIVIHIYMYMQIRAPRLKGTQLWFSCCFGTFFSSVQHAATGRPPAAADLDGRPPSKAQLQKQHPITSRLPWDLVARLVERRMSQNESCLIRKAPHCNTVGSWNVCIHYICLYLSNTLDAVMFGIYIQIYIYVAGNIQHILSQPCSTHSCGGMVLTVWRLAVLWLTLVFLLLNMKP